MNDIDMRLESKTYLVILAAVAAVFFVVYASMYWSLRPAKMDNDMWIFNTPDETANYFFIKNFSSGQLLEDEPLNEISGELNLVHSRSTTVVNDAVAPASFLGFLLTGRIFAKILSINIIPFIVPLVSIFGIIFFYLLIKEFFSKEIAFYSALLLIIMPAFWYYNSRSLFNNVLALDFLIIGFFLLISFVRREDFAKLGFSALFIGLALTIRTTDLLWVGLVVLIIFIANSKRFSWTNFSLFAFIVFLTFVPVLGYQHYLYGDMFTTGYVPEGSERLLGENQFFGFLKQLVAPFGFSLKNIVYNFFNYYARMFYWYFIPAVIGVAIIIWQWAKGRLKKNENIYLLAAALISGLVLLYYGSWFFYNNLMARPLIGSSQVRYLLPIYILAIPLAVYCLGAIFNRIRNDNLKFVVGVAVGLVAFYLSFSSVWLKGPESLAAIRNTVKDYHQINKQVRSLTEEGSVIVSSYSDKVFFPKRKVIFYWQDSEYLENIKLIAKAAPVYFYSIDPDNEINYIVNNSDFTPKLVEKITEKEYLYKLAN